MSKIKFYKDSAKTQQVYPELDPEDITKFESLEDIENALPNISGEDINLTLNHTVEAPMKLELTPSELEQETTSGKNLWSLGSYYSWQTSSSTWFFINGNSGAYGTNIGNKTSFKFLCESGKTYIFQWYLPQGIVSSRLTWSDETSAGITQVSASRGVGLVAYQVIGKDDYVIPGFSVSSGKAVCISNVMIEEVTDSSVTTQSPYEPYSEAKISPSPDYPQIIHTIKNDNTIEISDENLLQITPDNRTIHCNYISGANTNQYKLLCTASDMYVNDIRSKGSAYIANVCGNLIQCNYGETLYFDTGNNLFTKNYFTEFDENLISLGNRALGASKGSYTPFNLNCKYVTLRFGYGSPAETGVTYTLAPIVRKTPGDFYEPYRGHTLSINLGDLEYCKIGDYEDEFFKNDPNDLNYDSSLELDKWYLKKNVGKIVLDGSESGWGFLSTSRAPFRYAMSNIVNPPNNSTAPMVFSNYYKVIPWGSLNAYDNFVSMTYNEKYLRFRNNDITSSLDDFKIWLSTHNTEVYYVLETPEYILLNDTLQHQLDDIYNWAESYPGQTNIFQINNDLSFIISAHAMKDLSVIDKYPIENSEHLVESGGVYEVINDVNESIADIDIIRRNSKNMAYGTEVGVNVYLDDAYDANLAGFELSKETTQKTTNGNQLIDFGTPYYKSTSINFTFQNDILDVNTGDVAGNYIYMRWDITDIIKNNIGKTLKFGYENLSNVTGTGTIGQIQINYNDGTSTSYLGFFSRTGEIVGSYTVPQNVDNIENFYFSLYAVNSGTSSTGSFTITKPLLYFDDNDVYEQYTGASPSPSPDFPQSINVVEGRRNLFDGNYTGAFIGGGNGCVFNIDSTSRTAILPCNPNTTYTVTKYMGTGLGDRFKIFAYPTLLTSNTDMTISSKLYDNQSGTSATVTTLSDSHYLYVYVTQNINTIPLLCVCEGDKPQLGYLPYGSNYFILKDIGKNLLNDNKITSPSNCSYSDKVITSRTLGSYTTFNVGIPKFEIKNGDEYYVTFDVRRTSGSTAVRLNYAGKLTDSSVNKMTSATVYGTYTLSNEYQRVCYHQTATYDFTATKLYFQAASNASSEVYEIKNIIISKTPMDSYQPYEEKTIPFNIYNNVFVERYGYADKYIIDESTGKHYIYKVWGKKVLDGSESYQVHSSSSKRVALVTSISDMGAYTSQNAIPNLISSHFRPVSELATWSVGDISRTVSYNKYMVYLCVAPGTTIEDFQTWLSSNNVTIYYVLETPQLIEVPTTDITLFDGVNHISNSEDADMEITYVKDINIVINKLTNAIIEIGGE